MDRSVSGATCTSTGSSSDSDDETVNEFGFVVKRQPAHAPSLVDAVRQRRARKKWVAILADFTNFRRSQPAKFKRRVRKGIPGQLRGMVWGLLLDLPTLMRAHPGWYDRLTKLPLRTPEVDDQIARDLHRTFPNHSRFRDFESAGQKALRNVLHAYAAYNPLVGYVQGMAFLVATFLIYLTEEEAFWALHRLMETYGMELLFWNGLPGLQEKTHQLKGLMRRHLPELHRHFEAQHLEASFYAPQWFLTLYIYTFPPAFVLRIWDVFFAEGWKIIYRVPLALLKLRQSTLLKLELHDLMPALKTLADGVPERRLMRKIFRFKFPKQELQELSQEYWHANPAVWAKVEQDRAAREAQRRASLPAPGGLRPA
eukprot:EG_transcript_13558